jgi:hypothetical protein
MESSAAHTVEPASNTAWQAKQPCSGVVGKPRGTYLTYAASTIPEVGNCVISIGRTLSGERAALESVEIRAFRAEVQQRAAAPTMPPDRFLIHPAGLGIIRALLQSGHDSSVTVEQFSMAGNSAEQRRFHANIGIAQWLLSSLHVELATAGASDIEVPVHALRIDTADLESPDSLDEWSGAVLTTAGYRIEATSGSAHAHLHPQYLPR